MDEQGRTAPTRLLGLRTDKRAKDVVRERERSRK
jgi:hypothetical protein